MLDFVYFFRHDDGRLMGRSETFEADGWHSISKLEYDREQQRIANANADAAAERLADRAAARAALAAKLGVTDDELALLGR